MKNYRYEQVVCTFDIRDAGHNLSTELFYYDELMGGGFQVTMSIHDYIFDQYNENI